MKVLITSIIAALLLLNCKKSILVAEAKPAMAFNKQLVTMVEENGRSANLLYDQSGRLLAYAKGDLVNYYKPGYDQFVTQLLKESNEKITYQNAQQDAFGRIVKLGKYNNGFPESSIEFSYNENGQLVKRIISDIDSVEEYVYTYSEGNLVKIQEYENAVLKSTALFDYYKNQSNSIDIDIFDWKQIGFVSDEHFGKHSKNLTKSLEVSTPGGQTTIAIHYFYKTDANGYVRSMEMKTSNETLKKYNFIFQ